MRPAGLLSELQGLCGVGSRQDGKGVGHWLGQLGPLTLRFYCLVSAAWWHQNYQLPIPWFQIRMSETSRGSHPSYDLPPLEVSQCHFHSVGHSSHKGAWAWGKGGQSVQGVLNLWLETPSWLPISCLHYDS